MGQTLIGNKRSMIEFIEKNIEDDDIVILTDAHTSWEAKKKSGVRITSEFAKGTFKSELGVKDLMSGKNITLWIGEKEHCSKDTLSLYQKELKDKPMKRTPKKVK